MAIVRPLFYDATTGGYRVASESNTIDPLVLPASGGGTSEDSSVFTFGTTDVTAPLAVGEVVGVLEATSGEYNTYVKATALNQALPIGVVFSKTTTDGGTTHTYKAKTAGVLDTTTTEGGTITLTNTGKVWASDTGTLTATPPTATASGQTLLVGTCISATELLVNPMVMLYH